MCVKIWSDSEFDGGCIFAAFNATGLLIDQVAEFRNPAEGAESAKKTGETEESEEGNPNDTQMCMRKIAAELSFLLLAVVSVIENVVRTALALIAIIPAAIIALYDGGTTLQFVALLASAYFLGIFDQPLRCLVALVKNVTQERFRYQDLELCRLIDLEDC